MLLDWEFLFENPNNYHQSMTLTLQSRGISRCNNGYLSQIQIYINATLLLKIYTGLKSGYAKLWLLQKT